MGLSEPELALDLHPDQWHLALISLGSCAHLRKMRENGEKRQRERSGGSSEMLERESWWWGWEQLNCCSEGAFLSFVGHLPTPESILFHIIKYKLFIIS